MSPRPTVAFILGAGASHDAGLPLAADLTEKLREVCSRDGEKSVLRALGFIQGTILLRQGTDGRQIDPRIDIEDVLETAQLLAERSDHRLSGYVAAWHTTLEQLSPGGDGHLFRSLLARAREMLREVLAEPADPTAVKYLADVVRVTRTLCRRGGDHEAYPVVFTLNYDRCMERALEYMDYPFTTGFREGRWDAAEFGQPGRLWLFKLHGSFGWVRHPERGILYDAENAVGRDDIDIESYDVTDELVFGATNKLQATQPFLWMVNRFSEELDAAKYVITVGYGFGDRHVNELIGQCMAIDAGKRLVVVDPKIDRSSLEEAPEMRVYPERTSYVTSTAKAALHDDDELIKELERLELASASERPF